MNKFSFPYCELVKKALPAAGFFVFCIALSAHAGWGQLNTKHMRYPVDDTPQMTFAEGSGLATTFYIFDDSGSSFNNAVGLFSDTDSPIALTRALGSFKGFPAGTYTVAAFSTSTYSLAARDAVCGVGHMLSECSANGRVYARLSFTIDPERPVNKESPVPATSSPSSAPIAPQTLTAITHTLSPGSSRYPREIEALQAILQNTGHLDASTPRSGVFGPKTTAALKKFQCEKAIACSGSPATTGWGSTGPRTRVLLNDVLARGAH